ncbi:ATP-binding protein [Sulfitobacter sp. HNIBRBA2951]|uniref:PAS domain-containing hybrid sensor histidine kinase/response regulator n=1 Tax=Sulfitobacter aquimarinus TaxID=3158557 RepID=UPI0032DF30B4
MNGKIDPKRLGLARDIKTMPVKKLFVSALLGVLALQFAVFLQHGLIRSFFDYPVPIMAGVIFGLLIGTAHHIIRMENQRTLDELAQKEELTAALIANKERLSLAVERSHIWDWDVVTDQLYLSPGFAKCLGYSKDELAAEMQGTTANLLHPSDVEPYRARLAAHFKDPSNGFLSEHRFRTKSGQYKWFLAFGHSKVDSDGEVIRFAGATTDVSERVSLQMQLFQAQKTEAIGNLTGGVAHDFNNLLAIVMGNFELLREEITNPDHIQMIDAGLEATRRGADLTRSMLSFARKTQLEPEVADINTVVRHAKNWMRSGLPETVDIELALSADLWRARLDTKLLENTLLNLMLNAKDAMEGVGTLTIKTANLRNESAYADARGTEILPGRYVMVAISDTGTGVPADVLQHIFDPFFTTKPVGKGSGMGLPMVEGFVKQSGGTIHIYTAQGQGTTFKLYFPAICDRVDQADQTEAGAAQATEQGFHVLLVEDEDAVRAMLSATLAGAGYVVTTADNGDEALKIYTSSPHFDALVTDIAMPGQLQGADLAKAIRQISPDLPMIFISGCAAETAARGNGLRPHDTRLMKPVPRQDLLNAMADVLGRSKAD